ncbi:hypothetical protein [Reyranella sp.]|uniref:hypothetical protein n=1 Tax=Reyranella sp. TaxID=1929291 RepID=UPI003D130D2E
MRTMTDKQAYAAMYHFLDQYYQGTKSDDVGALLGAMSLLADGEPADPAINSDWEDAVEFALSGGKAGNLVLSPPEE